MGRARVPAPVPRIILWRGRFATISSISGITALRPRSMMLWPPILTTFAQGRMAKSGVASVARWSVASLSDPLTSRRPSSLSPASALPCISAIQPFSKSENPQLERVPLGKNGVKRAERRRRPSTQHAQRFLPDRLGQRGKPGAGPSAIQKGPGCPVGIPFGSNEASIAPGIELEPVLYVPPLLHVVARNLHFVEKRREALLHLLI